MKDFACSKALPGKERDNRDKEGDRNMDTEKDRENGNDHKTESDNNYFNNDDHSWDWNYVIKLCNIIILIHFHLICNQAAVIYIELINIHCKKRVIVIFELLLILPIFSYLTRKFVRLTKKIGKIAKKIVKITIKVVKLP